MRAFGQQGAGQGPINIGGYATGGLQNQTPSQRHPLGAVNANSVSRSGVSGYGMSAGIKVGRQQGTSRSFLFHLFIPSEQGASHQLSKCRKSLICP